MENSQKKKIIISFIILAILSVVAIFAPPINTCIENALENCNIVYSANNLIVHFISVGQGDAMAINLPDGKVVLIDTGPQDVNVDYTDYILTNVLNNRVNKQIDYLVLTHADADHVGGTVRLLQNFNVKNIFLPEFDSKTEIYNQILQEVARKDYTILKSEDGKIISGRDYTFTFFGPFSNVSSNENCPVIKLECYNKSFLFTGDITFEQENELLANYSGEIKADVLKVAHHGSKTASSKSFISKVLPKYAVVSCGKNIYGHPTDTVFNNFYDFGIDLLRTDLIGNIVFKVNSDGELNLYSGQIYFSNLRLDIRYFILIFDFILIASVIISAIKKLKNNKIYKK